MRHCCTAIVFSLLFLDVVFAAEPKIVSVAKIWHQGPHNAFTDLIRWHDRWYCTFREADGHVGGNGRLRVLESADGETWESAALVAEEGIDLRDPKLSITPDDRLMITAGGSVYRGKELLGRQPRVAFSTNGRTWTETKRIMSEGEWLWRVTWYGGRAYGVSYNPEARKTEAAQEAARKGEAPPGPAEWKLQLVASSDGVQYDLITHLEVPGHPNETTLRFLPYGEMIALVRREGGNGMGWIGRSKPPYQQWTWKETAHRLGGPNFIRLPDGSLWAAGREYPEGPTTVLATMTADGQYKPVLTFPSGGDTSYPGLVWHNGVLWMSYYSSHEGKSAIYFARIEVPLVPENIGSRREPMVDDYLFARLSGSARFAVEQPVAREVVLVADKPWEGNTSAYYTVIQDDDVLRMFYRGSHFDEVKKQATHREVTCYAESKDGIHWTKPELGLFEFDGSKSNNIVWDGEGTHCFTPFKDTNPQCAREARYKALTTVKGGLMALQSPDAIHWKPMTDKPVITKGAFDSQNLAFWDSHLGNYREYHRHFRVVRDIMTGTSNDFLNWTDPVWLDYPNATPEHLYTNAILPHPDAPHVLIGFPTRFKPATEQTEPTFMASRDGHTFRRYADAIIPPDAPEDRSGNRSNYMAWGVVRLPGENEEWSVYAKEAYYSGPASRLRRFTYRRDGFVALRALGEPGEAVTRPILFRGSRMVVNYRTARSGSMRIELQDASGKPIDQFAESDSKLFRGNEVAQTVEWSGGGKLEDLAGQGVRIRFVLQDAMLYSIRFE